mgnify:CR=1 FL=1
MLSLEHLAMKFTLTPIQSAACFHSFPFLLDFAYFAAGSAITKLQNTRPLWSASLTCVRRLWRLRHNTVDAILIQWHVNEWQGILQVSQTVKGKCSQINRLCSFSYLHFMLPWISIKTHIRRSLVIIWICVFYWVSRFMHVTKYFPLIGW